MGKEVKRDYKDSMFRKLFGSEDKIRELYNALENTNYGPDTPIKIQTLDNVIFKDIKDDLAFTIEDKFVVLVEHQSTVNFNMPARMLSYIGRIYEKMFSGNSLYKKAMRKLPAPEFFVIYNGNEKFPEEMTMKLSDAYINTPSENTVELIVKVFNVSYNENTAILKRSDTLLQYSKCMSYVSEALIQGMNRDEAVKYSTAKCREEGVLVDFINEFGGDSMGLLFDYVSVEKQLEIAHEDGVEEGLTTVAINMKNGDFTVDEIIKATGLSKEAIEAL